MATITEADGVFQGGGVKGLALVGAVLGFADHGDVAIKRWVNVAGTSAGAIIAAYLATDHSPEQLKDLLTRIPYKSFEDWGRGGEIVRGAWNLARHHGLAHGEAFRSWFDEVIDSKTFADVRRQDSGPDKTGEDNPYRLRLIATDATQHKMLVLPTDLANYSLPGRHDAIDPDSFPIANAVRMSMSIPYFFQPVLLEAKDTGELCTIIDGGVLSNFPVWLFDVPDHDPVRPTFGFHLKGGKGVGSGLEQIVESLGWPFELGVNIFRTTSDAWDERFMSDSTVVRTCTVLAGDIATTDFDLTDPEKKQLLQNGQDAAAAFLDSFDRDKYRNTYGRPLAVGLSDAATGG
jgi:NTE family protein